MSMLFRQRSTQVESMDRHDRSSAEVLNSYRELERANRLFFLPQPFITAIPRMLGPDRCRSLTILDVGAGDGTLGLKLRDHAAQHNWNWEVTSLDLNPCTRHLHRGRPAVIGSALAPPFPDNSFDIVIASQMSHHLADAEVVIHFREAWRVARHAIVLCDLHRNPLLYALVWLTLAPPWFSAGFRRDGLISVRKGFRLQEWRRFAQSAGIAGARVWLYAATRITLEARKPAAPAGSPRGTFRVRT